MNKQPTKKCISLLLSLLFLLGTVTTNVAAIADSSANLTNVVVSSLVDTSAIFTDVIATEWYKQAIDYVYTNNLMNGVGYGLFTPNADMSRAMLATVLYRIENEPYISTVTPFTDLTEDWYKNAVAWAYEHKIVNGTEETLFSPDDPITREQMATMLYRYADYKGYIAKSEGGGKTSSQDNDSQWNLLWSFPDGNLVSPYAKDTIIWAISEGLVNGTTAPDGRIILDPQGNASRAQVATVLMRFIEKH